MVTLTVANTHASHIGHTLHHSILAAGPSAAAVGLPAITPCTRDVAMDAGTGTTADCMNICSGKPCFPTTVGGTGSPSISYVSTHSFLSAVEGMSCKITPTSTHSTPASTIMT